MFAIEREINGASAEQRLAVRNERSRPLMDDLEAWLRAQQSHAAGRLARHLDVKYAPFAINTRRAGAKREGQLLGQPAHLRQTRAQGSGDVEAHEAGRDGGLPDAGGHLVGRQDGLDAGGAVGACACPCAAASALSAGVSFDF